MAFRWRAENGPPLNAGFVASVILGDPASKLLGDPVYFFVILQGGPDPLSPPPLDPHMTSMRLLELHSCMPVSYFFNLCSGFVFKQLQKCK